MILTLRVLGHRFCWPNCTQTDIFRKEIVFIRRRPNTFTSSVNIQWAPFRHDTWNPTRYITDLSRFYFRSAVSIQLRYRDGFVPSCDPWVNTAWYLTGGTGALTAVSRFRLAPGTVWVTVIARWVAVVGGPFMLRDAFVHIADVTALQWRNHGNRQQLSFRTIPGPAGFALLIGRRAPRWRQTEVYERLHCQVVGVNSCCELIASYTRIG